MGWVGSAMGYYRLLGDVSTPISTNYPLTVYTEYTGIVIQTRTCRAVGYWSSLAPEYRVLPTSPSPAVTRPYTSLLVLPRPESHPVPAPTRPIPRFDFLYRCQLPGASRAGARYRLLSASIRRGMLFRAFICAIDRGTISILNSFLAREGEMFLWSLSVIFVCKFIKIDKVDLFLRRERLRDALLE